MVYFKATTPCDLSINFPKNKTVPCTIVISTAESFIRTFNDANHLWIINCYFDKYLFQKWVELVRVHAAEFPWHIPARCSFCWWCQTLAVDYIWCQAFKITKSQKHTGLKGQTAKLGLMFCTFMQKQKTKLEYVFATAKLVPAAILCHSRSLCSIVIFCASTRSMRQEWRERVRPRRMRVSDSKFSAKNCHRYLTRIII